MNKKRNTIILAAVILLAAVVGLAVQYRRMQRETGTFAVVQSYGEKIARLPLDEPTVMTVGDEKNGYNIIRIESGRVCVSEADCPDQICVYEGEIYAPGSIIACLPHELIITIESTDDNAPDASAR